MSDSDYSAAIGARIALGLFLAGLLFLSYRVLHLFLVPVAWAVILVCVSWPAYGRLRALLGAYVNISALLMTLLLAGAFALPLLWVIAMLRTEVPTAYLALVDFVSRGKEALPEYILRIPWVGPEVERLVEVATQDPPALRAQLVQWVKPWADETLSVLGDIGRNTFKACGLGHAHRQVEERTLTEADQ